MAQMISLWTFACKLYNEPTVKNACLQLQDNNNVNVPLLLTGCWLAQLPCVTVSLTHAVELQAMAKHWSDHCIQPLRLVRQRMKAMVSVEEGEDKRQGSARGESESDCSAWARVREQVKATELLAEQQLLQQMEVYIQQKVLPDLGLERNVHQSKIIQPRMNAFDDFDGFGSVDSVNSHEQWIDHVLATLKQCLPALFTPLHPSPQARSAIADIILSIMAATVPATSQMSYDAVLERISR